MAKTKHKTPSDSQAVRRIKFGLNVAVAVIAAVGIVVLVNWIASRQYLRIDLTQNRSYSLSDQSRTVLDKLKGDYRIVTLLTDDLGPRDEQTALVYTRIRDLAEEYARYADNVTTDRVDARTDLTRADDLNKAIAAAFKDELGPVTKAIEQARAALRQIVPINDKLIGVTTAGRGTDLDPPEGKAQELLLAVATMCKQFQQTAEQAGTQADELMGQVLVNYAGIKEQFQSVLTDYDAVLGVVIERAGPLTRAAATDNADKERLLEVVELCRQAQAALKEPLELMQAAEPSPKYNQVFVTLTGGPSVVVLGPDRVKAIPADELWRRDMRQYQETGRSQPQYLIEEKLTGALLSMTLEKPPLIVFVLSGGGPALGPQGRYNIVAQRLQSADFEVTQWNPAGQMSSMGQPTPPVPRPQAQPGQKTVWVVLPTPGNQMNNPMMMMANPRQQIADLLQERLDAGDAAMVLLSVDPSSTFGVANPITDWLSAWGITTQTDRIVLEEVRQANRRTAASMQFLVDTWPDALPITTALNGMQAAFQVACPIIVGESDGTRHFPLVELKGKRLWAHSDLTSPESVRNAKFNEADSAESFLIGVASQRDGRRLATFTESVWASDDMTGLGLLGPGSAELTGAVVPANSELFVNSVLWLAGLEDLIAASPRSQDVPRINPMSADALWWYQASLLTGMPAAALLLGLGVWWVRRRA
jgi:ABC-type uncharacterized transport system